MLLIYVILISSLIAVSYLELHLGSSDNKIVNYNDNKNKSTKFGELNYSLDYAYASSASFSNIPTLASLSSNNGNNNTSNDFNFIAVGDWSCNPNTQKVVDNIITKDPELVLNLGDNSYEATADCWLKIVDPLD